MPRRISDLFHNELAQQAVLAREKTSLVVEIVIAVAPVVAFVVRRRVAVFVCPACSPERSGVIRVIFCSSCVIVHRCWSFCVPDLLSRAMLCVHSNRSVHVSALLSRAMLETIVHVKALLQTTGS